MKHKWYVVGVNDSKQFRIFTTDLSIEDGKLIFFWMNGENRVIDAAFLVWSYVYEEKTATEIK